MYQDNIFRELVVDNFAGGGGASTGMVCMEERLYGRDASAVDIRIERQYETSGDV